MVPLYAAMALGYASVKAKAFTAEQCAGINHFVAVFACPLLIFRMLASNDPYAMNLRFLAADTLQKLLALAGIAAWARLARRGNSLPWAVTLFSLLTLPNTVIMGVPVLRGMYGAMSETLMVQIVVLQFALWYIVVVFLLEYNKATNAAAADVEAQNSAAADADASSSETAREPPPASRILATAAKKILKLPNTYGSVLGFIWSLIAFRFNIRLPAIIDNKPLRRSLALGAMVARFVLGPAAMVAASLAVGLRGVLLRVGIVQAALPLAVLSFVYAEEYNVHPDIMSTGVIVGIFLSVPITLLYYVVLDL
ncbi:hypothetical protein ZIOFF_013241 [Zingiber officinale]|uniref:Auxin efflux carrier component n=1 Tax=Zingiber officinale TaxID=94328 RepID=A0A8J5HRF0_ZINOF|nr:hypothetical protein ZIOFF_013241 [Zingiber officinale]